MSIITDTQEEVDQIKELLQKELPTYREAFSDRTCFLMACLSELVYLKFNEPPLDVSNKKLVQRVSSLLGEKKLRSLYALSDLLSYDCQKEKEELKNELKKLDIKLEKLFDKKGTQAMMVSTSTFYILVFRGTEPTSIEDIKSDLEAKQVMDEEGKMHLGFKKAFEVIEEEVQTFINKHLKEKPLLITGHSLGGALATVATKKLNYDKLAACYTFGSPRVGNEDWMLGIKAPIYRIVNSADPVTMLPPGTETIDLATFVCKFIPLVGESISKYLDTNFSGYTHVGYMRYLTNIENGEFQKARLLYSVSFLRRIRAYFFKNIPFKSLPADHSMTTYRKKLQQIAFSRNQ